MLKLYYDFSRGHEETLVVQTQTFLHLLHEKMLNVDSQELKSYMLVSLFDSWLVFKWKVLNDLFIVGFVQIIWKVFFLGSCQRTDCSQPICGHFFFAQRSQAPFWSSKKSIIKFKVIRNTFGVFFKVITKVWQTIGQVRTFINFWSFWNYSKWSYIIQIWYFKDVSLSTKVLKHILIILNPLSEGTPLEETDVYAEERDRINDKVRR